MHRINFTFIQSLYVRFMKNQITCSASFNFVNLDKWNIFFWCLFLKWYIHIFSCFIILFLDFFFPISYIGISTIDIILHTLYVKDWQSESQNIACENRLLQFSSRSSFDMAVRQTVRKGRLYKLEKVRAVKPVLQSLVDLFDELLSWMIIIIILQVDRSHWDFTTSYDGKAVSNLLYFFIKVKIFGYLIFMCII